MSAIKWLYAVNRPRVRSSEWALTATPWHWSGADRTVGGEMRFVNNRPPFTAALLDRGYTLCIDDDSAYAYWQAARDALNPRWEQLQREGRKEVER